MEFLEKDQLSRAIENQTQLDQDLRSLLEMLSKRESGQTHPVGKGPDSRVSQAARVIF